MNRISRSIARIDRPHHVRLSPFVCPAVDRFDVLLGDTSQLGLQLIPELHEIRLPNAHALGDWCTRIVDGVHQVTNLTIEHSRPGVFVLVSFELELRDLLLPGINPRCRLPGQ